MRANPTPPRLRTSCGATAREHHPTTTYGMATAHCGASSQTWRNTMPAAAPPQTMLSIKAWGQPDSANPATPASSALIT